MIKRPVALSLCLLLAGVEAASAADRPADRERQMMRRLQQQVQQMQGQASALEQEKARLSQDLGAAAKDLETARGRVSRLSREVKAEQNKREETEKELGQTRQELSATREQLARTEARLAETAKNLNDTRQTLAMTDDAKKNLEIIKVQNEREIAVCEDKNGKLYQYGRELMARYEKKSCGEFLVQKEPFTGFKQVEIENLLEEYRDKLDPEKITRAPGPGNQ